MSLFWHGKYLLYATKKNFYPQIKVDKVSLQNNEMGAHEKAICISIIIAACFFFVTDCIKTK